METSKAMTKGMNKINDVKSSLFICKEIEMFQFELAAM